MTSEMPSNSIPYESIISQKEETNQMLAELRGNLGYGVLIVKGKATPEADEMLYTRRRRLAPKYISD